jgi:hypothetical protein
MQKHVLLVILGILALLVGAVVFSMGDSWSRSVGQIILLAGVVFVAAGLGVWAIVDAIQGRRGGL